jgi:hypothetical protein
MTNESFDQHVHFLHNDKPIKLGLLGLSNNAHLGPHNALHSIPRCSRVLERVFSTHIIFHLGFFGIQASDSTHRECQPVRRFRQLEGGLVNKREANEVIRKSTGSKLG